MSEQMRYSAQDIHRMRGACFRLATPVGYSYKPDEVARTAETMLVTYMANGTTADELVEHASEQSELRYVAQRRVQESMNAGWRDAS